MLSFVIGLYLGVFFGVLVAAMCAAAARGDAFEPSKRSTGKAEPATVNANLSRASSALSTHEFGWRY